MAPFPDREGATCLEFSSFLPPGAFAGHVGHFFPETQVRRRPEARPIHP